MVKHLYLAPHNTVHQLEGWIMDMGFKDVKIAYSDRVSNRPKKGWRKVSISVVVTPFRDERRKL